jgi:tetratricopeptide (TPR) repeat protein
MDSSIANRIGKHTICYGVTPADAGCSEFEIVKPAGVDALIYEKLPTHLRDVSSDRAGDVAWELLEKYRTSTYTSYILWGQGHAYYDQMTEVGAEKDFQAEKINNEAYAHAVGPSSREGWKVNINRVIEPWDEVYRNFPDFIFRAELLYGLSRAYLQLGQPQKAVPLLKELLERFPSTEHGKKGIAYKQVLQQHGIWKG